MAGRKRGRNRNKERIDRKEEEEEEEKGDRRKVGRRKLFPVQQGRGWMDDNRRVLRREGGGEMRTGVSQ